MKQNLKTYYNKSYAPCFQMVSNWPNNYCHSHLNQLKIL